MQSHCVICYTGHLAQESLIVSSSCESSSISLATGRASTMRCLRFKRSTQPPLRARPFIMHAGSGQSNTAPGTQQRLQQLPPSECPIGAGSSWTKSAWLGRSFWGAWITGSDQSNLTPTSSSSIGKAKQGKARVVMELSCLVASSRRTYGTIYATKRYCDVCLNSTPKRYAGPLAA